MRFGLPDATDGGGIPSSKGEQMQDALIEKRPELRKFAQMKDQVILFYRDRYIIVDWTKVTKQMVKDCGEAWKHPFTIPDRIFIKCQQYSACYVDGSVHLGPNISKRDDEIDAQLQHFGIMVLRQTHTTTLSGVKANVDEIERFVLGQ